MVFRDRNYRIRFTPRRPTSVWSNVNVKRVAVLKKLGRMTAAGLAAFAKADAKRSGVYSFERKNAALGAAHEKEFKANEKAWEFFRSQAPSYQRTATYWVISAKQEEDPPAAPGHADRGLRSGTPAGAVSAGTRVTH